MTFIGCPVSVCRSCITSSLFISASNCPVICWNATRAIQTCLGQAQKLALGAIPADFPAKVGIQCNPGYSVPCCDGAASRNPGHELSVLQQAKPAPHSSRRLSEGSGAGPGRCFSHQGWLTASPVLPVAGSTAPVRSPSQSCLRFQTMRAVPRGRCRREAR